MLAMIVLAGVILYVYRRETYENDKDVKDVAKEKDMSQKELDAVLKFIKQ